VSSPSPGEPSGVLPVDKPLGWTSHDVVAVMRGVFGVRRIGHGGTLDPQASGVLPILVGPATRFVERLHAAPKVYAAVVRFGTETSTDDREGTPTRTAAVPVRIDDAALAAFRGPIEQVPPDFAAVKVGGRPAYRSARAGAPVALEARTVTVERLDVAGWTPPDLRLLVVCSTGTYVRAIARDLGRSLGSAAHLGALRRLAVGALDAADARGVEEMRRWTAEAARQALRPANDELLVLPDRYRREPADRLLAGWEA
jgi:tRNA pseudouridine55 synthase